MKKISFILVILLVILLGFLSGSVQAADETVEWFMATSIEIQSTTSTYTTGTVLTITLKNTDGDVEITDPPELIIQFGDGEEIEIRCDTQPGLLQALQYTYTIKDSDVGELKILREQQTISNGKVSSSLDNITLNENIIANSDNVTGDEEDNTLTWTDFSNVTFEWSNYTETDHRAPRLNINGVEFNNTSSYWFYMTNDASASPDLSKLGEDLNYWKVISDGTISSASLLEYIQLNGNLYIWIAEVQGREKQIVVNAKEVERLEQAPLTKRLVGYFSSDGGSVFCFEPYDSLTRRINVKIGRMTDETILRNIKNNTANAMSDLLSYAKSADLIYEEKGITFGTAINIPDVVNFTDDAYYYAYIELDDENGKYYPVEDVELYQASVSEAGWTLLNHTDRDFVYNIDDDIDVNTGNNQNTNNQQDNTIAPGKIPQTGINAAIISIIVVLAAVSSFIAYKTTKYRDIK